MYKYSYARTGWGEVYGIPISSFTTEQLKHMDLMKLIEFVDLDQRVADIICDKVEKDKEDTFDALEKIKDILPQFPEIVKKYNKLLLTKRDKINRYSYHRFVFWNVLDEHNKDIEYERWSHGLNSAVLEDKVDYEWLNNKNPSACDNIINKVPYSMSSRQLSRILETLKKPKIDLVLNKLETSKWNQASLLACPLSSDKQIIKGLRAIHKKTRVPTIRVNLNKDILGKLPSIMRLDLVEAIINSRYSGSIVKNNTEEELRHLLFPSMVRYPDRINRVVKRYIGLK